MLNLLPLGCDGKSTLHFSKLRKVQIKSLKKIQLLEGTPEGLTPCLVRLLSQIFCPVPPPPMFVSVLRTTLTELTMAMDKYQSITTMAIHLTSSALPNPPDSKSRIQCHTLRLNVERYVTLCPPRIAHLDIFACNRWSKLWLFMNLAPTRCHALSAHQFRTSANPSPSSQGAILLSFSRSLIVQWFILRQAQASVHIKSQLDSPLRQ